MELDFNLYTVAWIAPLEIEAKAARSMLDQQHEGSFPSKRGDGFIYTAGDINGHNVVIATFPADHPYGTNSAAALASDLKAKFPNLWFGLLVGVAAGLPNLSSNPPLDIRLGDILVASGFGDNPAIINYEFGKETPNGFELSPRGALPKTEQIVRAAIGRIKESSGNLLNHYYLVDMHLDHIFKFPGENRDKLYQGSTLVNREARLPSQIEVWYGTMGSGNKLIKDSSKRDELRDTYNVIGLEMEAAGIMNILPVGVIRGVSDYGDSHKNKEWQPYAALTAAAYAKSVLEEITPQKVGGRKPFEEENETGPEREKMIACLRSLSFSNIDDRHNNISLAHENTCDWLYDTLEFQKWQRRVDLSNHNGIIWIKGKPGSGKSTLMKHTLQNCKRIMYDRVIAAYFFNARGSELEQTPLGMLRSLVFQLVDQLPRLFERFFRLYLEKWKKHGTNWEWQLGELKDFLLLEMRVQQLKPILILVDALDECTERDVRDVVYFIERLSKEAYNSRNDLNICLSSRHYPTISISKCINLELETQRGHDRDIHHYIISSLRTSDEIIEKQLLQKANHVFMWVVLVVEMLNMAFDQGRIRAMKKKLDEIPSDLEEVYTILLKKDNPHPQETLLILQWVLFARKLLRPAELYFAVLSGVYPEDIEPWESSEETRAAIKRYITNTSRGLIEVRESLGEADDVQFIHYSVNDFLLRNRRLAQLDPRLEETTAAKCHNQLTNCCIAYIKLIEETSGQPYHDYPFLAYATRYVFDHAAIAQSSNIEQDHLITWLELPKEGINRLLTLYYDRFERAQLPDVAETVFMGRFERSLKPNRFGDTPKITSQGGPYGNSLQFASLRDIQWLVEYLLSKGADVNAKGEVFGNALHVASAMGHLKVVKILLSKGKDINVNAVGGFYGTAVEAASAGRHSDIARLLQSKGADTRLRYNGIALNSNQYQVGTTL